MEEYTYNIKIAGNGTQRELAAALRSAALAIELAGAAELDGAEWENSTIVTQIEEGTP